MIKRTYYLYGEVTADDIQFLHRTTVDFRLGEQEYLDFIEIGTNIPSKIAGKKHPAEVITASNKEDTWLKLYFSDRLCLIEEQFNGYDSYKYYD